MMRPSPSAFVKAVWNFAGGTAGDIFVKRFRRTLTTPNRDPSPDLTAMTFAPLALRETGAVYVFDRHGLRLEGGSEVSLGASWSDLSRVALQIQHSRLLGLKMLRMVLWPTCPHTFLAAHPGSAKAWDPESRALAFAVVTATTIPQDSIDSTLTGLTFSGARFNGRVEEAPPPG